MNALERLAGLLRSTLAVENRLHSSGQSLDKVIRELERYNQSGTGDSVREDLQQKAIIGFWDARKFDNLRDARLVSFGMCVPVRFSGPCIMEDRLRFMAVLDRQTGVDQWLDEPRWFRRCYQGLLRSYFSYDIQLAHVPAVGKQNWEELRDYLHKNVRKIVDQKINPDWVKTAKDHQQLFTSDPCAPYVKSMLKGEQAVLDGLREQLGIIKASWFHRELILAQLRHATTLSPQKFTDSLPEMLGWLARNELLRSPGLILILDHYVTLPQRMIHDQLRNCAVDWWGNPWLASHKDRWGGVSASARDMVSEWLKREFVEAFFSKLAEDGVGDRRRANFWLRYVKSMDNIHFALGPNVMNSPDVDFVKLRQKMRGLINELKTSNRSNNAFIMTMGQLVVVEFGGKGHALYGYDARRPLPFELSKSRLTEGSLKHPARVLWLTHQDRGYGRAGWEKRFEIALKEHKIIPNAPPPIRAIMTPPPSFPEPSLSLIPAPVPEAKSQWDRMCKALSSEKIKVSEPPPPSQFSKPALLAYASEMRFLLDDLTGTNGNLWLRTLDQRPEVANVLKAWNFSYRVGKGWWRDSWR